MKIEEMLDIFDIDEIEKMSPEECKGLLKGFFIGAGFLQMITDGISEAIDERVCKSKNWSSYSNLYITKNNKSRTDFRSIHLEFCNRADAEEVLEDLSERLETSNIDYVTVRDLYSLADLPTNSIMLNWVWYDLKDCRIEHVEDHYILVMPPAEYRKVNSRASDIS